MEETNKNDGIYEVWKQKKGSSDSCEFLGSDIMWKI